MAKMANDNPVKKDRLDKKYVGIIVKDNQPLSIRDNRSSRDDMTKISQGSMVRFFIFRLYSTVD
jgi:hypothetical protein